LLAQGGARFARSLVETGLIDEYRLVIHPVVLGSGEQVFTAPLAIEPISTTAFSCWSRRPRLRGALFLISKVADAPASHLLPAIGDTPG
jgi:hypothetical protein